MRVLQLQKYYMHVDRTHLADELAKYHPRSDK